MTIEDLREFMTITINATAERLVLDINELSETMRLSGASPKEIFDTLDDDLQQAGRIFGAFRNKSRAVISNGIENAGNIASEQVFSQAGVERFMWVTTGGNVCPDCKDRAGMTGKMSFFANLGLPKSGFSVCREHCQCQLVPIEYDAEGIQFAKIKKNKK